MWGFVLTAALFLIGGAVVASIFFVSNANARREGYKIGYAQAQKEHNDREAAARWARLQAEQQMRTHIDMVKGFPSAEFRPNRPVFMEVVKK